MNFMNNFVMCWLVLVVVVHIGKRQDGKTEGSRRKISRKHGERWRKMIDGIRQSASITTNI